MTYQLTSLGISVLSLLRDRSMHGYRRAAMGWDGASLLRRVAPDSKMRSDNEVGI